MARTATGTTTKAATRRANTKSKDADGKAKRPPSAYNLFIGALWKDAPENPKRGQEAKEKAPKASKRPKKAAVDGSEGIEGPQVEPGSDE
ncbi:hypothetical protein BJV78DRAFT_1258739 [Lactifluus subvellereus]|nr:hypothetical protein BJV78DRAFT_1258739 [Lactifluus subvellereus]